MSTSSKKNRQTSGNTGKVNKQQTAKYKFHSGWFLGIAVLLAITYIVYSPALKNGITGWDDKDYIVENKVIQHLDADFFHKSFAFHTGFVMGNYHPITMLSYALEYKFSKLKPETFHRTNLILHLLNGLLVFLFVWLLCKRELVALISGALFLLHPMHVESVAWIAERKDLLYCFFELASLSAYILFVRSGKNKYYIFCFVFFLMALLSKAMAVAMVGILPLLDFYFNRNLKSRKVILEKIPFLLTGIFFGLVAVAAQKEFESIASDLHTMSDRILFAGYSFITYIWKSIFPINLNCFYDYPLPGTYSWYFLYVLLSAILLTAVFFTLKKTKIIFFGFFFFTFSVALVLQLLPVGGAILAERYSYIPYIGIFYMIGEGIYFLLNRKSAKAFSTNPVLVYIPFAICVIALSYISHERCKVWKDTISIWDDVLNANPNVVKAYAGRGQGYNDRQQYTEAIKDFNKALELKNDYADVYYNRGLSYYYLGKQLHDNGQLPEAQQYYQLSIDDNSSAIHYKPNLARAYFNRSGNYYLLKQYPLALQDALKAKELGMEVDEAYIKVLQK